jgi:hypothetical protein
MAEDKEYLKRVDRGKQLVGKVVKLGQHEWIVVRDTRASKFSGVKGWTVTRGGTRFNCNCPDNKGEALIREAPVRKWGKPFYPCKHIIAVCAFEQVNFIQIIVNETNPVVNNFNVVSGTTDTLQPVELRVNSDGQLEVAIVSGGGGGGGDATAANQTAVQANPGVDAAKAIAIQGIGGGQSISVTSDNKNLASEETLLLITETINNADAGGGSTDKAIGIRGINNAFPIGMTSTQLDTTNTLIGATNETPALTDTSISGLNGLFKRTLQRLSALINLFPTSLGRKASASSLAVALSNEDIQDVFVTGQSGQSAAINNILTPTAGATATDCSEYRSATIQIISNAATGALIFEGSNNNINFEPIPVTGQNATLGNIINGSFSPVVGSVTFILPIEYQFIKLRIVSAITGGTVQAFSRFSRKKFAPITQKVSNNGASDLTVNGTVTANQGGTWNVNASPIDSTASGTLTTADIGSTETLIASTNQTIITGIPTPGSTVTISSSSFGTTIFAVTGTWTGTLQFEVSVNGANHVPIQAELIGSGNLISQITTNGVFRISSGGSQQLRLRAKTLTSGSPSLASASSRAIGNTSAQGSAIFQAIPLIASANATGAGNAIALGKALKDFTVQLQIISGTLTAISADIQISLRNGAFQSIATFTDITDGGILIITNSPALFAKVNITTLTGTSPVISLFIVGV